MKKYLFLLLLICSCATPINPPCSHWIANMETKYPLFVESKAIKITNMDDLMQIMDECKVKNIIRVDNDLYAITE